MSGAITEEQVGSRPKSHDRSNRAARRKTVETIDKTSVGKTDKGALRAKFL